MPLGYNALAKQVFLANLGRDDGGYNELLKEFLATALGISSAGLSPTELWHRIFDQGTVPPGAFNWRAHFWLTTQGIPEGGTLNERFYKYWELETQGGVVLSTDWVPALVGADGAYVNPATGSLTPSLWGVNQITYLGSDGLVNFRVSMPQFAGVTQIRATVRFQGPKFRQADLTWNTDRYEGVMDNARELAVPDIGNVVPVVLRQLA